MYCPQSFHENIRSLIVSYLFEKKKNDWGGGFFNFSCIYVYKNIPLQKFMFIRHFNIPTYAIAVLNLSIKLSGKINTGQLIIANNVVITLGSLCTG